MRRHVVSEASLPGRGDTRPQSLRVSCPLLEGQPTTAMNSTKGSMQQKLSHPLRIFYLAALIGGAGLFFAVMLWAFQSGASVRAEAMSATNAGCQLVVPATCNGSAEFAERLQPATTTLLALYALAFDNEPGSPSNLSAYYTLTVQSIVSATAAAPDRVAVILADLDGYGDTRVLIVQNGVAVPVAGLPTAPNLSMAVTLDPQLQEYNMADGWYLGNFIRWARQLYPASQTLFSFVGHGAPLTPQLQPLNEGVPVAAPTTTPTPVGTPTAPSDFTPLPPRWGAHSDLTDYHAASLISVRALAQALSIGTNNGAEPLTVVDLLHCFSATIEELYEIHPYAKTILAAPNYTYAEPTMLGKTLALLDPMHPPATLAKSLVAGYDNLLPTADHPRLFIAVDADKVAPIKAAWDQTSAGLLDEWAANPTQTRDRLLAAYHASAKYDTTICQPQDWTLAPPDALSDMADFAGRLGAEFGTQSLAGAWAITTTKTISAAMIARYSQEGVPWFADPPVAAWRFPAAGIALFTDLAPAMVENRPRFSWQAAWYTTTVSNGNPYPYAFLRPTANSRATWADLVQRFWTKPITETTGCVQGFVNGRGPGALSISALTTISNPVNASFLFSATVHSVQAAANPLLRFRAYRAAQVVFETVVGSGYFAAGTHRTVQSTLAWQPSFSDTYLIEAMIDVDQRFSEVNESDNRITITLPIQVRHQVYLPVVR